MKVKGGTIDCPGLSLLHLYLVTLVPGFKEYWSIQNLNSQKGIFSKKVKCTSCKLMKCHCDWKRLLRHLNNFTSFDRRNLIFVSTSCYEGKEHMSKLKKTIGEKEALFNTLCERIICEVILLQKLKF